MKEKSLFFGKVFLISFAGALLGSAFFVAVHGLFTVVSLFLYLASGIVAATFYANFIKADERNIGTHLILDFSLILGVFASQLIDFMICYAGAFTIPGKESMGAFSKTFYTYFKSPYMDKIAWSSSGPMLETSGALSVWTTFIVYTITAFIGLYIVFAGLKIGEIVEKRKASKSKGKKKK